MDMLDATLAFALTLAALATIVTIILESIHRMLRVRKWNLILTMKKLSREISENNILSGRGCWDFVANVLNNGTRTKSQQLLTSDKLIAENIKPALPVSRFLSFLWDNVSTFSYGTLQKPDKAENKDEVDENWITAIESIQRNNATRGVFDKVSLEHVLRRFSELDEVKAKLDQGRDQVEAQLDKIARKYEEFASSVTADFKRRAQMWSIVIGIIIALAANVNAVRIFEGYLKDKNLTTRVIGKFEEFEKQAIQAQKGLEQSMAKTNSKSMSEDKYAALITKKQTRIERLVQERGNLSGSALAGKKSEIKKEQRALKQLIQQAYAESEVGKSQLAMNKAGENLRAISELGVPIGINYFPHCMLEVYLPWNSIGSTLKNGEIVHDQCLPGQAKEHWVLPLLAWIIATGLTGILIGMGAPFWFDVARRIAEVRSMFNGKPDNEKRMGGKDIDGDHSKRKELVKAIVKDAIADQSLIEKPATNL